MNEKSLKLTMEALEKIKEVCASLNDDCFLCAFQIEGECVFTTMDNNEYCKLPYDWEVRAETIIHV